MLRHGFAALPFGSGRFSPRDVFGRVARGAPRSARHRAVDLLVNGRVMPAADQLAPRCPRADLTLRLEYLFHAAAPR
jgi:hypothetical protein